MFAYSCSIKSAQIHSVSQVEVGGWLVWAGMGGWGAYLQEGGKNYKVRNSVRRRVGLWEIRAYIICSLSWYPANYCICDTYRAKID